MANNNKIKMTTPIVEMDGDEMTRIIWQLIKDELILPFVDLKSEYYDLGLEYRDETNDQVTIDSANATKKYGVAVKCATITPNAQRMTEYTLKEMWKSPNGTIRAILDGTVFRAPIIVKGIDPLVPRWTKPITIARHAYGDMYRNVEFNVPAGSKAELIVFDKDWKPTDKAVIHDFEKSAGIVQGVHNTDSSIESFARACFNFALDTKQDLWFATKDTISKTYDHHFKDIYEEIYEKEYKAKFEAAGIEYFYTLIDDAVARVMRSDGGYIWACKNYDGDVMSDMVATAFGSLGMMTSVLCSPDGAFEYEAAHGTVTRHYYKHLKGEPTSTNSVATIFAWTGGLKKRGELDNLPELVEFAEKLEKATIDTIESGVMTGDLYSITSLENKRSVSTQEFIKEVASRL
jgi:isocitrate dehydrogenase